MLTKTAQVALLGESLLIEGVYMALKDSLDRQPIRIPTADGDEEGAAVSASPDVVIFEFNNAHAPDLFGQFMHDKKPSLLALCSSCDQVLVMSCTPKAVRGIDDVLSLLSTLIEEREETH